MGKSFFGFCKLLKILIFDDHEALSRIYSIVFSLSVVKYGFLLPVLLFCEAQARAELFYLSILSKTFNNYHFLVERLSTEETISLQTLLWLFKHPVLCKPFFFKGLLQNIMLFKMYAYRIWQFYYHISEKNIFVAVRQ